MKKIVLFAGIIFIGCNQTKYSIKSAFNHQVFIDTSFATYQIPFRVRNPCWGDERFQLRDSGFLNFIGYGETGDDEFTATKLSDPYLVRSFSPNLGHPKNKYDIDSIGEFNYYRLTKLKILKFNFLSNGKDSLIVTLNTNYFVTPMFKLNENKKVIKFTIVKRNNNWQILNLEDLLYSIYINKSKFGTGCDFYGLKPCKMYQEWFQNNLKLKREKNNQHS